MVGAMRSVYKIKYEKNEKYKFQIMPHSAAYCGKIILGKIVRDKIKCNLKVNYKI